MKATEIICVIDKSGSMFQIQDDAIGGFNKFLEDQQKLKGKTNLTVILFDTSYTIWDTKPIKKHKKLTKKNYVPSGATALLDAVGRGVTELKARLNKMTKVKRPDKVIFLIITDGQENASVEFKVDTIKKMIEEQKKKSNWQFMFVGAGIDAFAEAGAMGIARNMTLSACAGGQGVARGYGALSRAAATYSMSGKVADDWDKKEEETGGG